MLDARLRKNLDYSLLFLTFAVAALGLVTIYSATRGRPGTFLQKQFFALAVGTVGMVGAATIDYAKIARYARGLYVLNVLFLAAVFKFGAASKGAVRWINLGSFQAQPSEFAKLIMIVCLAAYLVKRIERIREPAVLFGSFLYIALPMALILKQPDLGTSLVLIAIWFGMTYIAGARALHLAAFLFGGLALFGLMWRLDVGIHEFQKRRMESVINPAADPKGAAYQVRQAQIAIGSGQVWGKGLGRGTQARGKFIPENHTDFIYTVVGEEGGFVAAVALVVLYAAILIRGAFTIVQAEDVLGKLLAAGIVSMYAFHIIVNMGMTIGIMPVTGVPLPLVSYGGSNLLLNLVAIGLLLGIGMRRHRLVF